ncbi:hypothetical protein HDK64DRAFT_257907 [Phyllosticta capitalensis]
MSEEASFPTEERPRTVTILDSDAEAGGDVSSFGSRRSQLVEPLVGRGRVYHRATFNSGPFPLFENFHVENAPDQPFAEAESLETAEQNDPSPSPPRVPSTHPTRSASPASCSSSSSSSSSPSPPSSPIVNPLPSSTTTHSRPSARKAPPYASNAPSSTNGTSSSINGNASSTNNPPSSSNDAPSSIPHSPSSTNGTSSSSNTTTSPAKATTSSANDTPPGSRAINRPSTTNDSRPTPTRGWARWEEEALEESVRYVVDHQNGRSMGVLRMWEVIAARAAQNHGLSRPKKACRMWWNRKLRARTQFDERKTPNPGQLVTCAQEAKKPRAEQEVS